MSVLVDSEKCKCCGICVSLCPVQAISIIQNKAFINQNSCNECLQCISECPADAIYQTLEKEISVTRSQDSEHYPLHRISPQSSQILGSYNYKREPRVFNRNEGLLDRIKEVANSFFQIDSSFGRRKKGGRGKHIGYGRGYRGGRVKH